MTMTRPRSANQGAPSTEDARFSRDKLKKGSSALNWANPKSSVSMHLFLSTVSNWRRVCTRFRGCNQGTYLIHGMLGVDHWDNQIRMNETPISGTWRFEISQCRRMVDEKSQFPRSTTNLRVCYCAKAWKFSDSPITFTFSPSIPNLRCRQFRGKNSICIQTKVGRQEETTTTYVGTHTHARTRTQTEHMDRNCIQKSTRIARVSVEVLRIENWDGRGSSKWQFPPNT